MPEIPEGARKPEDHKSQVPLVKPDEHPAGWELLRPIIDAEEWETAPLLATLTQMRTRGEELELAGDVILQIGELVKTLQLQLAINSSEFKAWLKSMPDMTERYQAVVKLAVGYGALLGEASGSAS